MFGVSSQDPLFITCAHASVQVTPVVIFANSFKSPLAVALATSPFFLLISFAMCLTNSPSTSNEVSFACSYEKGEHLVAQKEMIDWTQSIEVDT